MELLVDSREPPKTFNILDKQKILYKKTLLTTGDFVVEEKSICIERKAMPDFAASIIDGRLKSQVARMKKNYKHNFVIISGRISDIYWKGMKIPIKTRTNQVLGAMASLAAQDGISVICVDNDTQLVYCVTRICEKVTV